MGKRIRKTKKAEICLEPDGYSVHTLEISQSVSKQEWEWMKEKLYKKQQIEGSVLIYPNRERAGRYICTGYAYAGIRILLEKVSVGEGADKFFYSHDCQPQKADLPPERLSGDSPQRGGKRGAAGQGLP